MTAAAPVAERGQQSAAAAALYLMSAKQIKSHSGRVFGLPTRTSAPTARQPTCELSQTVLLDDDDDGSCSVNRLSATLPGSSNSSNTGLYRAQPSRENPAQPRRSWQTCHRFSRKRPDEHDDDFMFALFSVPSAKSEAKVQHDEHDQVESFRVKSARKGASCV